MREALMTAPVRERILKSMVELTIPDLALKMGIPEYTNFIAVTQQVTGASFKKFYQTKNYLIAKSAKGNFYFFNKTGVQT